MRQVTIYGIREVGTEKLLYVGASTDLRSRRTVGYSPRVTRVLSKIDWEYVVLELTRLDEAPACELRWIQSMRAAGHPLRNSNVPGPKHYALATAPSRSGRSGPSGKTELIQCKVYLSKSEQDVQKALANAAGLSWSTWARRKLAA